jgi:DNA-binding NarL/FixJ family response regulator
MQLKTYLEKPMTRTWFDEIIVDLKNHTDVINYYDFNTLLKSISNDVIVEKDTIIVIDFDSIQYIELIGQINEIYSNIKLIGIGYPRDLEKTLDVLRNGVHAYLEIGNSAIDFYYALRNVKDGIMYLPMYKVDEFIRTLVKKDIKFSINKSKEVPHNLKNQLDTLTHKQREVCDYLLKGYSYKEISQFIGLTTFTINQRAKSIYKKMGVNSRGELSYLFIK